MHVCVCVHDRENRGAEKSWIFFSANHEKKLERDPEKYQDILMACMQSAGMIRLIQKNISTPMFIAVLFVQDKKAGHVSISR